MRNRYWCYTLNNYTIEELNILESLNKNPKLNYHVWGKEVGDSGTPHIQGYFEWKTSIRQTQAKKLISSRCHIEPRRGSAKDAAEYCKKDGDYQEYGKQSTGRGQRSDLGALYKAIQDGWSIELIRNNWPAQYIRYKRSIDDLWKEVRSVERDSVPDVVVLWGKTGAGKTRYVWDNHARKDIYATTGERWFDGYAGESVVLFDDFNGSEFKLSYFLKLLDRYPFKVPIKGGFVQWNPKKIFITSNKDPKEWYLNSHPEQIQAMFRRFTEIKKFD